MVSIGVLQTLLLIFGSLILFCFSKKIVIPKKWPLIGMLPIVLLQAYRIYDLCTKVLAREKGTFQFQGPWFSNMNMLITADPANIRYVLNSNVANFPKGEEFKEILEVFGDGIFSADSDSWTSQRKVAQELITDRSFYQYFIKSTQEKIDTGLIPVLDHVANQELVLDLQDVLQRFSFDATCIVVAGYDPKCLSIEFPEVEFSRAVDNALEATLYRHILPKSIWKLQRWLGIGVENKFSKAQETLDRILSDIIAAKDKDMKQGTGLKDGHGIDLLTSYMSTESTSIGTKLDYKFLGDVILNFLMAGRDTIASTMTWFFWLVSENPQVETKIIEELRSILPSKESDKMQLFKIEDLKKLVYLHGSICEALRLYPPVPFNHKSSVREDTLPSGHFVCPKMKVIPCVYAMGRMSSIWGDDCLEFKPERWISQVGEIKHEPSYKFAVFGAGPRICLGKEVALVQMKAIAASVVYNYHVQVVQGHNVVPSLSIILRMKHGLKVRISRRWMA
ncbi:hypothetical protein K2173_005120 [Erythroxylum novogranatense]|uniref:Cytochrome P450 n=1 Tax=Erythroxylum novogranatense TaxID=1862640 RepID=A0AAV8TRI6_9ROSI|nr:hypothetical protein K2173_005120 [Erythroxylum novogranatense]